MNEAWNKMTKKYQYLALGDSYTIGEGVAYKETWVFQLTKELEKRVQNHVVENTIIAKTGWRTDELYDNIIKQEPTLNQYNIVSLLIGVNDEYQNKPIKTYVSNFRKLLSKAISLSLIGSQNVFVVSIPNYGVTPFGKSKSTHISKKITEYNNTSRSICEEKSVTFIDIFKTSMLVENNEELLVEDRLHPSEKQYELWTKVILESDFFSPERLVKTL